MMNDKLRERLEAMSDSDIEAFFGVIEQRKRSTQNTRAKETWLKKPHSPTKAFTGEELPTLAKAPSATKQRKWMQQGWTIATDEDLKKWEEIQQIPQEVIEAERAAHNEMRAVKTIMEFYGKRRPEDIPPEWREKLYGTKPTGSGSVATDNPVPKKRTRASTGASAKQENVA